MSNLKFSPANVALISSFLLISSSFHGASALFPYKRLHNSSHLMTLKPEDWTSEFSCELERAHNETGQERQRPHECFREPTAWRFNYVFELTQGPFRLLVKEGSLDERLANSIYTSTSNTGIEFHSYKFNSGSRDEDLRNERLVAGVQVDDSKCLEHLNEMLSLLEEIHSRIEARKNDTNRGQEDRSRSAKLELELEEQHFRLGRALDSYGRFESGSLSGRYLAMGIYQQCITTPLQLAQELVPSRYCWARMSLDKHLSEELKRRPRFVEESDNFQMMVAVCLPESCHSKSFNPGQAGNQLRGQMTKERLQRLIDSQYRLPESVFYERRLELESVFCLVDENSKWAQLPLSGKLFLVALGAWLALVAFATHRRRRKHTLDNSVELSGDNGSLKVSARSLLNNLDIFESWAEFIGARDVPRRDRVELDVLNPMKFIGSIAVMITHSAIILGPLSREGMAAVAFCDSSRFEMLFLSGFVLVDTFFVISGILLSFIVLKRLAKERRKQKAARRQQGERAARSEKERSLAEFGCATKHKSGAKRSVAQRGLHFFGTWFYISLHRYLRIVPLFFVVFSFKKTLFNHLGSGPLWDWALNKDTAVGSCRNESWLTPFSFLSAYLPLGKQCLPPTWSVSNDLFFSLFVPPLIILFHRRPQVGKYLAALLVVVGFALSISAYYSIDLFYRFELERIHFHGVMILLTVASQLYTNPTYRIPAILVGIVSGHALFRYEQRAASNRLVLCEKHDWSWWFRKVATPAAIFFVFVSTTMSLLTLELRDALGPERTAWLVPLTLVSYHVTWSTANAVIFLRMLTDWKDSFIMKMCAGPFWRAFSKLTYAILLVHWDLLMYEASSRTSQLVFSRSAYFSSFAMAYFWSIPLAIFLHVAIENPIDKLIKSYLLRG